MKQINNFFKPILQSIIKSSIMILIIWKVILPNSLGKLTDKYEEIKENFEFSEYSPSIKYRINDFLIKFGLKEKPKNSNFYYIVHDPNEMTQIEIIESNDDTFELIESEDTFELIESEDIFENENPITLEDILGLEDNLESLNNMDEDIFIKKKILIKK